MEKRKLGKSGIEFAPIAFGGNVFGWTADEATSHRILDAFVDAGFSFIDTADVYSRWVPGHKGGESEAIIGSWLKKNPAKRAKVQIATKCGMVPADGALKRDHIKWSVDESLKRLNTDHIELFQSHKDDKATPLEETLSTYGELIKAGKLGAIGASNYDAPRLAEAAKISKEKGLPRYESLQPHYNLMERGLFEGELEKMTIGEVFLSGCEFHEEIIRGAGNPFFLESLRRVNSIRRLFAYRSFADRDGMRRHVREHLRLLEVLETRRYAEAAELMAKHLQRPLVAGLS